MKFWRLTIFTLSFLFLFCHADETMAAVAYRSSRSTTYATRTNTTITAPAGIQNNDVLIILFGIGASGTPPAPAPPAGFNIITGFPTTETDAGGFKVKTYAWYKIASGESGNYTITHSSAASQGYMAAVSGADIADPFHQNPTTNTGSGTVSTALGLTTPADNSLVIYLGSDWGDNSNALSPPTGTTPTFNERLDPGTVSGIMYVADGVLASQGTTGNKTQSNNSNSGNPWMASLICVNPMLAASAAVTGTITTAQETDIVSGGKTIVMTLSGDTWVAAGATFDAQRQNIINGLVSSQSETYGWNNEVKAKQGVAGVVRTSNTIVTITLDAEAAYSISSGETITATVPGSALTGGSQIVASPNFSISAGLANVFYSVGQNATDHSSGGNVSITNGVATFTVAQTASNLGVGDRLTYGGHIAYLASKIDTTHWNVADNRGIAAGNHEAVAVFSIAHEYTSLSAAEAGAGDSNHLNSTNLTAGNYILNIPCYYDDGPDEASVVIDGWTTSATNYINIYTPNNILTEVNQSQRHAGKWDDTKYRISTEPPGTAQDIIRVIEEYVRLDGLQIEHQGVWDQSAALGIRIDTITSSDTRLSNNIIKYTGDAVRSDTGISDIYTGGSEAHIWNNIVYDFTNGGINVGYHGDSYVYNNTVYGNDGGIDCANPGYATAKNNLSYNNSAEDYSGTFDSSSTNNLSKDATAPALGTYYRSALAYFVDAAGKDFHLSSLGGTAKKSGANLSADANLPFDNDIDGEARSTGSGQTADAVWDIGADQITGYVTINSPRLPGGSKAQINMSLTDKMTNGLVGMWSFDGPDMNWADTTSEAKDRSGNNNHGDVDGATAAAGKIGQALSFNGSSNYVTIGDVLDFNYNGQFSVSAWIKPNALPGNDSYKCIVSKMDNEAPLSGWYFGLWNSLGQLGLYYDDNSGNQTMATTNEIINTGIWQHVVGVYNNETITIYLNGVPQSNSETATAATSSVNNNVPLCIGCDDNATDEIFDGAIDEVRVYSRALSPAEIGDLYHMGQATLVAPKRQCFQTWFDDFSGSWPGNWRGDTAKFVITDGELEENLGPDDLGSVYYNSPVNSAAQYCKFTNAAEGYPFNDRSGCIFRATGENGYRYAVWIDNDGDLAWDRYNGSTYVDTIDGVGMSKNNGDTFGITVQGAGTGTVVKVWRNPSGDVPFDKNNWKSINDPAEATLTDGSSKLAAAPADLGTYVGAHMSLDSIEGNSRLIMDDMFGGWCR